MRHSLDKIVGAWKHVIRNNEENPYFSDYDYFFRRKNIWLSDSERLKRKLASWKTIFGVHGIDCLGKTVIVPGSGAGVECIYFCLMGAESVTALEIQSEFVEGMSRYLNDLNAIGIDLPITPELGDAHETNHSDRYDVIVIYDCLSHFYDYEKVLRNSLDILNSRGTLIVIDDNNLLNLQRRRELTKIWDKWENRGSERVSNGKKIIFNSYWQDRYEMIASRHPNLGPDIVEKLSNGTAGLRPHELYKEIDQFLENGTMPNSYYVKGSMSYDTKNDMPKERPFNPYALAKKVNDIGYRNVRHLPNLVNKSSMLRKMFCSVLIAGRPCSYVFWSKGFSLSGRKP